MPDSIGDDAQIRSIVDAVAKGAASLAISEFVSQHPEVRQSAVVAEIPTPLKWAGGIAAALLTTGIGALAFWLVSSVSAMQVTLGRMDERMASYIETQGQRMNEIDRRLDRYNERLETLERKLPE